jgi:hypothetical protein
MSADTTANQVQVGGDHYRKHKIQPWDAFQDWMTPEQFSGFLRGSVMKYLSRYRDKAGIEDLKKARHVLDKLIEVEEGINKERS